MSLAEISSNEQQLAKACFKVIEMPVYGFDKHPDYAVSAKNKKMLCTFDEDGYEQYLSIVNSTYKVIDNKEVLNVLFDTMDSVFSWEQREKMEIITTLRDGGATTFVEVRLPRVQTDIETNSGFKTRLYYRSILRNTFDGMGAMRLYTGNIDRYCTNGMIGGDYTVLSESHRSMFNPNGFAKVLENTMTNYLEVGEKVKRWAKVGMTDSLAAWTFNKLVHGDKEPSGRSNDLAANLFVQYSEEKVVRGENVFALASAMTHYASHAEGNFGLRQSRSRVVPVNAKLFERQEKVRGWFNSEAFKSVAYAA